MRMFAIDYETFFTDAKDEQGVPYNLTHHTTESYVRHPWFEAHGAAIKRGANHAAKWYDERQLKQVLVDENWSDVFLLAHHMQFDGLILSHHYGIRPKMYGCTMSMFRLLHAAHLSASLDSVRKLYGMAAKRTPYHLFKGKRWAEMTPQVREEVARGAEDEVESIWRLFEIFMRGETRYG